MCCCIGAPWAVELFLYFAAKHCLVNSPWVKGCVCSGPCLLGLGLVTLTNPDVMVCNVPEPAVCWELLTCVALLHPCQDLLKRGLLTLLSQGRRRSVRLPSPGPRGSMVNLEGQWWGQGLSVAWLTPEPLCTCHGENGLITLPIFVFGKSFGRATWQVGS